MNTCHFIQICLWHSISNVSHWKVITGLVCLIRSVWLWFGGWFQSEWEWRAWAGEGPCMSYTSQISPHFTRRLSGWITSVIFTKQHLSIQAATPAAAGATKQAVKQPDTSYYNLPECNACAKWVQEVKCNQGLKLPNRHMSNNSTSLKGTWPGWPLRKQASWWNMNLYTHHALVYIEHCFIRFILTSLILGFFF